MFEFIPSSRSIFHSLFLIYYIYYLYNTNFNPNALHKLEFPINIFPYNYIHKINDRYFISFHRSNYLFYNFLKKKNSLQLILGLIRVRIYISTIYERLNSYYIDFDNMPGIVSLFGKQALNSKRITTRNNNTHHWIGRELCSRSRS